MKEERKNTKVCFLVSVNRAQPAETATEAVELLIKYRDKAIAANEDPVVVGLELSGDPRVGSFSTFRPEFERAQSLGFKVSLHCAETKEQTDSQEMIDFKPDRLGHCCYLSKEQIQQVVDLNIPVEICPTSNVAATQCGLVQFLKHLQEFARLKHNMVVCCDDTLLFNTNLSAELFEFAKATKITEKEDLKQMLIRNVDAIFCQNEEYKNELRSEIRDKY